MKISLLVEAMKGKCTAKIAAGASETILALGNTLKEVYDNSYRKIAEIKSVHYSHTSLKALMKFHRNGQQRLGKAMLLGSIPCKLHAASDQAPADVYSAF